MPVSARLLWRAYKRAMHDKCHDTPEWRLLLAEPARSANFVTAQSFSPFRVRDDFTIVQFPEMRLCVMNLRGLLHAFDFQPDDAAAFDWCLLRLYRKQTRLLAAILEGETARLAQNFASDVLLLRALAAAE